MVLLAGPVFPHGARRRGTGKGVVGSNFPAARAEELASSQVTPEGVQLVISFLRASGHRR